MISLQNAPILIERGALGRCEGLLPQGVERWAIVADEQVAQLYGEALHRALPNSLLLTFPAGESSKCLREYEGLCRRLLQAGVTRRDGILALGGGVCGDLAGFAAATLLRGIALVHFPTTLLAQVDSSVGGKVGVDLPEGKNLLGAFYPPQAVIIDPDCLATLPPRQLSCGMAEVIKYGLIADPTILELLEQDTIDWTALIRRCVAIKADIVAQDERDMGLRRILNFGHTFGHVYEAAGGYDRWTHGEAVAAGMAAMLRWQQCHGDEVSALLERLTRLLARYRLPTAIPCDAETARVYLRQDKKHSGDGVAAVLVKTAGQAVVQTVSIEELLEGWA